MHAPPVEGQAHFRVPSVQTIGPMGQPIPFPWVQLWILSWETINPLKCGPLFSVNPSAAINIPTKPWWKGRFFRFGELSDDLLAGSYQLCWCQPGVWADTNCSTPQDFKVYYLGEWWWFQTVFFNFYPKTWRRWTGCLDKHIFRMGSNQIYTWYLIHN